MLNSLSAVSMSHISPSDPSRRSATPDDMKFEAVQKRFEQLLWSEMLSQSGLEDALTKGGGQAAAPFARYVVEAIAKDIADMHPLGLAPETETSAGTAELKGRQT